MISKVFAAPVSLGEIEGVGKFQEKVTVSGTCTAFGGLISSILTTLTVVGGLAFVLYFTMGALKWLIAGGDKGKISEAKEQMTQSAIGLIAIVVSFFIIGIVGAILGLDILRPFNTLFGIGCVGSAGYPGQGPRGQVGP